MALYEIHYALVDGAGGITRHGTLENFETDLTDEGERKQAARTFMLSALGLTRGAIVQSVIPSGALDFLPGVDEDDEEDFDVEPEIGDEIPCHYCHQLFEYTGDPSQQVGAGMYWCGCAEEATNDKE